MAKAKTYKVIDLVTEQIIHKDNKPSSGLTYDEALRHKQAYDDFMQDDLAAEIVEE